MHSGQLLSVLLLATVIAAAGAWIIAWRYRRRMQALMALRPAATPSAADVPSASIPAAVAAPARRVTQADNRRAGRRLALLLVVVSLLIAASSGWLWYRLAFPEEAAPWRRVAVVALLHAWPVVPALALLWRWPWHRLVLAMLGWIAAVLPVFVWRQIDPDPLAALVAIALEIGPTMLLVALVFLGSATRAVAPWLLPPVVVLVALSHLGMAWLGTLVERRAPLLEGILSVLGVELTLGVFVLGPWLLAWWPVRALGRAIARAYARHWLTDLLVLFTGVWAFALLEKAVTQVTSSGAAAFALLLPLLWIPALVLPWSRLVRRTGARAPTLLVLRVFQQDEQVQALYDRVVERWRLSGPAVMIAGTDLALRTIDADDVFTFLDGRLHERFVASSADLTQRLASAAPQADLDGRWRVDECYCHDTTWQDALRALVGRSDVVLMDLRGFQAHNAGCRFELETLSAVPRPLRVVVLADARTDRAAAQAAIGTAPAGRFVWVDASRFDAACRREVVARLFD